MRDISVGVIYFCSHIWVFRISVGTLLEILARTVILDVQFISNRTKEVDGKGIYMVFVIDIIPYRLKTL